MTIRRTILGLASRLLVVVTLAGCVEEEEGPADVARDVATDSDETDAEAPDAVDAEIAGEVRDAIEDEAENPPDTDVIDGGECAVECVLGYNRDGVCCNQLLAEVVAVGDATPGIFRRVLGCPCVPPLEASDDDRCSFDYEQDLVCPNWTWQGEYNGDGPAGDATSCMGRVDWIVESTGWIPLDRVTDRDRWRELVGWLQPCPDPYGGEL